MSIKQVFFCLGLILGISTQYGSLKAADIPPVAKNSADTIDWKIKNLKNDRNRLKMRLKILQDSASRKLTQDWLGYRTVQRELAETQKQIQEIDVQIQELEQQKQNTGSAKK